jgi:serine/threonine-protein kinase
VTDANDRARQSYSDTVAHADSAPGSVAPAASDGASSDRSSAVPSAGPRSSGLKRVTMAAPRESTPPPPSNERTSQDPFLGYTIDDRYEVEAVLGEGGMGVVYRCRHTIIGKKVAMKVLRADMARSDEVTERFLNEARSASSIGNPHIIDISDFGRLPDGSTYFIMEFLEGLPLSAVVESGPVPITRLVHIAEQLAEGLFAAHEAGIVHRDLKPDNIFLVKRGSQKDFVKILDFGIAKASSTEGKLTQAGAVFGTPHYMSPEQAAGTPIDHRSDIYSFGVILYELASGKVPFDADNFMGILTQHMYKSPVPIRALVPEPQDVPPGLEAIILKCLSKRTEHRYQTMQELLDDLKKVQGGQVPGAVADMMSRSGGFNVPQDYFKSPNLTRTATPVKVRSKWPLFAGIAGVSVAIALVVAIFAKSSASDAAPSATGAAQLAPTAAAEPAANPAPATEAQPVPAEAPARRQIVLAVQPLDAHVFRGDEDLGVSPVVVEVAEGEKLEVVVRRRGYKEQALTLDSSVPKRSVKLSLDHTAAPARPATQTPPPAAPKPPKKKPSLGGGEIVNPWE